MNTSSEQIQIYDTTLRDGAQTYGVSLSVKDRLSIAAKLDEFGIDYIEGGWPASNPNTTRFFSEVKKLDLPHSRISAFGSTRRAGTSMRKDVGAQTLLEADTAAVTIFGKSWRLHVKEALRTTLKENLSMISDTVSFMKDMGREVIYDAEHFFDGFLDDPEYTVKTLEAAVKGGADMVVLCDTNGGMMPEELGVIVRKMVKTLGVPIGIHTHNDSGVAVANTLEAVRRGAVHVHGTINGIGERCGNADLCGVIPNLALKYKRRFNPAVTIKAISQLSYYVAEFTNIPPDSNAPFVGHYAFAHKGGIHVSAVNRNPRCYEHVAPQSVGNVRRILVSEQSGKSNIDFKVKNMGLKLSRQKKQEILNMVKEKEIDGLVYEGADASFEILVQKAIKKHNDYFKLHGFRIIVENRGDDNVLSEATIKIEVKGEERLAVAEGDGPVNALDKALRTALEPFYPQLKYVHLSDFKVRVIDAKAGTAAKVRVLIESRDNEKEWGTVGISENLIEASWMALTDSIDYKLMKDENSCN